MHTYLGWPVRNRHPVSWRHRFHTTGAREDSVISAVSHHSCTALSLSALWQHTQQAQVHYEHIHVSTEYSSREEFSFFSPYPPSEKRLLPSFTHYTAVVVSWCTFFGSIWLNLLFRVYRTTLAAINITEALKLFQLAVILHFSRHLFIRKCRVSRDCHECVWATFVR